MAFSPAGAVLRRGCGGFYGHRVEAAVRQWPEGPRRPGMAGSIDCRDQPDKARIVDHRGVGGRWPRPAVRMAVPVPHDTFRRVALAHAAQQGPTRGRHDSETPPRVSYATAR